MCIFEFAPTSLKIKLSHCSFKRKFVNNTISMESLEGLHDPSDFRFFFTSDSVRDKPFTFPHKVGKGYIQRERERERGRIFCALNDLLECCRK